MCDGCGVQSPFVDFCVSMSYFYEHIVTFLGMGAVMLVLSMTIALLVLLRKRKANSRGREKVVNFSHNLAYTKTDKEV